MSHSFTNLLYHLVFSTKDRRPWLDTTVSPRLHEYIGGIVRSECGIALLVNGMPDHLHILARLRQDKALADVVRSVKANSSGWLHDTFPALGDFAWQSGYAAFTVSASQKERVYRYIEKQQEHHRKMSFQEEFLGLLRKHGIEFDERYVWG